MYEPDEMGRTARQNNFEAMALMKDAKNHICEMRRLLYTLINDAEKLKPKEIRKIATVVLGESDQAMTAADEAVHWLFENELLHVKKARRGTYNTKENSGS
jgi:hypothetical protein